MGAFRSLVQPRPMVTLAAAIVTMAAFLVLIGGPAGAEIQVGPPSSSTVGQPVTVTATVTDAAGPVADAEVTLAREASIAGVTGYSELASGLTGRDGTVTLEFVQYADSGEPGQYRVAWEGPDGEETAEFELSAHPGPQQYVTVAGVDAGPVNVGWLLAVLAMVWGALGFAVFQLVRVARASDVWPRAFPIAPHVAFGFVAFTAIGMFLVIGTRPETHAVLSPTEPFERNPSALIGVSYDYLGHGDDTWLDHDDLNGQELYILAGCAGCHGLPSSAQGIVGGDLETLLGLDDAVVFNDLVRLGPGGMPTYGESVLSDVEIERIRLWILAELDGTELDPTEDLLATIGGPYSGDPREGIVFDGTDSTTPAGNIVTYRWDFGDGGPIVDFGDAGGLVVHSFADHGTYDITLTVIDENGASASSSTTAIVGTGRPPPTAPSPGSVATGSDAVGAELYATQCASCHGPDRFGGDLTLTELSPEEQIVITRDGSGTMPAFGGRLSDDEIDQIVQYVLSLGGG